jgi:mRNA-degrading endonuclease RelE of RelBE toxin-antitoxin system
MTEQFKKQFGKIKDNHTRIEIVKCLRKLEQQPELGKPLNHNLKNHRAERISCFRLIYSIENDCVIIHEIEHRARIYHNFAEKYINYNSFYN